MSLLLNGNCLEEMKSLDDDSIDLIFCDLPYGQTSCKWDSCIDLELFWKEVMRIKKLHTPIFFTTTTKFGVSLITSAPKKCFFRYDIVWVKSAPAGFLSAKKMPMRKHEMVYVFYEKLPFYDLSSHTHKFIKEINNRKGKVYNSQDKESKDYKNKSVVGKYDPPLPVSVVKETEKQIIDGDTYNTKERKKPITREPPNKYDPPLPVSVVKEDTMDTLYGEIKIKELDKPRKDRTSAYDPPLPVSVVKEDLCKYDVNKNTYGGGKEGRIKIPKDKKYHETKYNPPLPVSVVKEDVYGFDNRTDDRPSNVRTNAYDPPLPTSMLEIKSTRGKHSTEKPVALMEWILKYYSKEGDVILDPTMGSGSTGIACKNMNRNFIGIEMDTEIYEGAVNRLL